MLIQSQASNVDIISDDVSLNLTSTVCDLERLIGVLETGRALRTEKDVIAL